MLKNEPKTIDWSEKQFQANGKTYYYTNKLSIRRYKEFERLAPKVVFDSTTSELAGTLLEIFQAVTTGNEILKSLHKVAELSYNQLHRTKENFEEKEPAVLWFCTLFLCLENEDTGVWNKALAQKKINDWEAENIAIESFFLLSISTIPKLTERLKSISKIEKPSPINFTD